MAMTPQWLFTLKLLTALGCGLVAGVFFAFSTFFMPAQARLQPPQGIAAMQSINITAIDPLFMLALYGTAAVCIFLTLTLLLKRHQPSTAYLLAGRLLYLVATVGVTIAFNVLMNEASAIADPSSTESANL